MVVPAQSSKRWDLVLIWEGALPGAHSLTLLHFANNSFNPQFKHHAFQKAFTARLPPPTPPAKLDRGPALYGHSSLCQPLLQHIPHQEEMICLCIGLSQLSESWNWLTQCSTPRAPNWAKQMMSPQKKKKKRFSWSELNWNIGIWAELLKVSRLWISKGEETHMLYEYIQLKAKKYVNEDLGSRTTWDLLEGFETDINWSGKKVINWGERNQPEAK